MSRFQRSLQLSWSPTGARESRLQSNGSIKFDPSYELWDGGHLQCWFRNVHFAAKERGSHIKDILLAKRSGAIVGGSFVTEIHLALEVRMDAWKLQNFVMGVCTDWGSSNCIYLFEMCTAGDFLKAGLKLGAENTSALPACLCFFFFFGGRALTFSHLIKQLFSALERPGRTLDIVPFCLLNRVPLLMRLNDSVHSSPCPQHVARSSDQLSIASPVWQEGVVKDMCDTKEV